MPLAATVNDNFLFWATVDPPSDVHATIALDTPSVTDGTVSENRFPLTVRRGMNGVRIELNSPVSGIYFKNAGALGATESYMIFVTGSRMLVNGPL